MPIWQEFWKPLLVVNEVVLVINLITNHSAKLTTLNWVSIPLVEGWRPKMM